jgi:sporulation protein YlmC with PRC-barrel domain
MSREDGAVYNRSMLQLCGYILNKPVLSIRTGGTVAWITDPIINPHKLSIEGFYVQDSMDKQPLVLLCQDIREFAPQGFIINDHDVLAQPEDLVRLKGILSLNFSLIGKPIVTTSGDKVGKVSDYAVETSSMYIQKIYAARSVWQSLASGSLSIDRSQIIEITTKHVVIGDLLQATPSAAPVIA